MAEEWATPLRGGLLDQGLRPAQVRRARWQALALQRRDQVGGRLRRAVQPRAHFLDGCQRRLETALKWVQPPIIGADGIDLLRFKRVSPKAFQAEADVRIGEAGDGCRQNVSVIGVGQTQRRDWPREVLGGWIRQNRFN